MTVQTILKEIVPTIIFQSLRSYFDYLSTTESRISIMNLIIAKFQPFTERIRQFLIANLKMEFESSYRPSYGLSFNLCNFS